MAEKISSPQITAKSKKKRVKGHAFKRLARASARILRDNSDELVKALYDRALAGDAASGKLLLAFLKYLPPSQPRGRNAGASRLHYS